MFDFSSFIKSFCYRGINKDDEYTLEDYTQFVLENFNDTKSIAVYKNIQIVKDKIISFLNDIYIGFDIKLSPIHNSDNWNDKNYVYIAVGVFYPCKNTNKNSYCFVRLILKIKDNTITIKNKQIIEKYIDKKYMLS